jgi:hypothetical protein
MRTARVMWSALLERVLKVEAHLDDLAITIELMQVGDTISVSLWCRRP